MVSGYNYCGYTAAQHSGAMRLSQCLMAFPAARVGFIGSPAAEWRYLMASRLVTGFAAFCFRQPSISFPRSKVSPFQAQPSRHFLCRVKASDSLSDLELEREGRKVQYRCKNGIFWILLLNIGIFVTDRLFQFREIKSLYLYHNRPFWYQFITSTFCHANWNHLSSNLFFLYIFGKLVEEEEGTLALWLSYLATGAGANMVSWLILPRNAVSVGASGAVFGLFAISVLVKVMEAAQASTGMAGPLSIGHSSQNVNHIAHLSGALFGVALIFLISQIPSKPSSQNKGC